MANKKNEAAMALSDFNMVKLNTKELKEHVSGTISIGENVAIIGMRGTGKTMIAKQSIQESGCLEAYINLSVLERTDLMGFPKIMNADPDRKFVDYLPPAYFETMMDTRPKAKKVVALLDEVDKADPSLWAPLLEFTQFRSINGIKLPNLQAVIMTGNLISEGGTRPSLPLLDRAEKYLVEADATSWLEWAGKTGEIHPAITAYVSDHPADLFGNPDPQDRYADPSPRGWHRASQILFAGEKKGWSSTVLNKKVSGCVGKDAGIKYSNYYEHYQQLLPMIDDIFKGKVSEVHERYNKLEPTKKLVASMITCARLANMMDEAGEVEDVKKIDKKLQTAIDNVGKFLSKVEHENVLVSVRSQIQIERLMRFSLDDRETWQEMLSSINKQVDNG